MAKNKPEKIGKKYGKLFVKDYDYENNLYICAVSYTHLTLPTTIGV